MENTTRRLLNGGAHRRNANMCVSKLCGRVGRTESLISNALQSVQRTNRAPAKLETAACVWAQKIKHGLKTTVILDRT